MADTKTAKATARIDATHMGGASLRDDAKPKPQPVPADQTDEDWGVDANNNGEVAVEDDLNDVEEREIENTSSPRGAEVNQTPTRSTNVSQTTAEPEVPTTPAGGSMTADDFFAMMERMEAFKQNAINDLQGNLKSLDEAKAAWLADYDQKRQAINEKLAKLGVNVQTTVSDENEPQPKQRGGRRRRRVSSTEGGNPAPAAAATTTGTSGRRTRPKNEKTLKEAIVEVLTKRGRSDLKTIASDIAASGFKSNSKKFGNTVRVQLYRLDDDGEVVQYDDNTFGLVKK